jgi:hypothetical protein
MFLRHAKKGELPGPAPLDIQNLPKRSCGNPLVVTIFYIEMWVLTHLDKSAPLL